MSGAAAIGRYHWQELVLRWRAQPASPLARWFLTFALCSAAGVLLLGFAAAESSREAELARLGLNTVMFETPAASTLPESASLPPDSWAASLAAHGRLTFLQQLPEPALTPWGDPMPVFLVGPATAAGFISRAAPDRSPGTDAVWMTRSLPPGRLVRLSRRDAVFTAQTAEPAGALAALGLDEFVLAAAAPDSGDPAGRLDLVLFDPGPNASAAAAVRAARRYFAAAGSPPPVIRDPGPYRQALDAFRRSQARWRTGLALLLCGCIVLAYGSIAMLEERQTRFNQALLRSLGVSGFALWTFSFLENVLLADTALVAALAAGRAGARALLALAGAPAPALAGIDGRALLWLACAVNAGLLLGLVPLARALRRPVGSVLP